jgi:hypothetical protein
MVAQRGVDGRGRWQGAVRPHLWVALPILVLAGLCATGVGGAQAAPRMPAAGPPSLTIVNPAALAGPVGTNVTARIAGAPKNHVFNIAYAQSTPGCTALGASSSTIPAVTVGGDGTVQFSFAWPADSGTGSFVLCAMDQQNPLSVLQSMTFNVLAGSAPQISIQPAPQPTPTGTAPASTTTPGDTYTEGEGVIVQGTNFLPGGTSVEIALAGSPDGQGTVLSQQTVNSGTDGSFETQVTLNTNRIGNLYIQALTTDGGNNQPPSLLASTPITIGLPPSPTPTPSPTATSTPQVTPTTTGGTGTATGGNGGTLRVLGIAGLGSFSVLLLLVGTALLISAGRGNDGMS